MNFKPPLIRGTFVRRRNRVQAWAMIDGQETYVHLANTGRLQELLEPGRECWLRRWPDDGKERTTAFSLVMVKHGPGYVSIDTGMPNRLVQEGLAAGFFREWRTVQTVRPEYTIGDSRLDFRLETRQRIHYVEVKSVTLANGTKGLFPDAPTTRGAKHVRELTGLMKKPPEPLQAWVLLLSQRNDITHIQPNAVTDPDFAEACRQAKEAGVRFVGCVCTVNPRGIHLEKRVPVRIV